MMNDDPAGEAAPARSVSDDSLERILRDAFTSLRLRRPPRPTGVCAAITLALALTLVVFCLMTRLLTVPVVKVALPVPLVIHGVTQTTPNTGNTAQPVWRSALPPLLPSLAPGAAPRLSPLTVTPLPAAREIDWARALHEYLEHSYGIRRGPFEMPKLPQRLPSVFSLPERMRLSTGGEIDRIGDHCYAVPSGITYNPEATGSIQYARYMHTPSLSAPLFTHEVSCGLTETKTWGEDFLLHLARHGYAPPKP